jgi:hypothetical protein
MRRRRHAEYASAARRDTRARRSASRLLKRQICAMAHARKHASAQRYMPTALTLIFTPRQAYAYQIFSVGLFSLFFLQLSADIFSHFFLRRQFSTFFEFFAFTYAIIFFPSLLSFSFFTPFRCRRRFDSHFRRFPVIAFLRHIVFAAFSAGFSSLFISMLTSCRHYFFAGCRHYFHADYAISLLLFRR